ARGRAGRAGARALHRRLPFPHTGGGEHQVELRAEAGQVPDGVAAAGSAAHARRPSAEALTPLTGVLREERREYPTDAVQGRLDGSTMACLPGSRAAAESYGKLRA